MDPILSQVNALADYEALREVVNQLGGLLVARQRAAGPGEGDRWQQEHLAARRALAAAAAGTPQVGYLLAGLGARLEELRRTPV